MLVSLISFDNLKVTLRGVLFEILDDDDCTVKLVLQQYRCNVLTHHDLVSSVCVTENRSPFPSNTYLSHISMQLKRKCHPEEIQLQRK